MLLGDLKILQWRKSAWPLKTDLAQWRCVGRAAARRMFPRSYPLGACSGKQPVEGCGRPPQVVAKVSDP